MKNMRCQDWNGKSGFISQWTKGTSIQPNEVPTGQVHLPAIALKAQIQQWLGVSSYFCWSLCIDITKALLLPAKHTLTVKSSRFGKYAAFCKCNKGLLMHLNMWFWKNLLNSFYTLKEKLCLKCLTSALCIYTAGPSACLSQAESCWAGRCTNTVMKVSKRWTGMC